ncbi:MAG: sialate O-acetylesterase [Phaeodactylibacter sp.]|nr:sialate O-acetylesterase [Phaeodactylibacter sp.]
MRRAILSFLILGWGFVLLGQELPYDTAYHSTYWEQKVSQFRLMPESEGAIVFLGNSITDVGEWVTLWQDLRIHNQGISADITFGVLARLDAVARHRPEKVFLMIGINDIARGIPDSVIIANHRKVVDRLLMASPETAIYLQSVLPTNSDFTEFKNHQNKQSHIVAVNIGLKQIAEATDAVYVDLHAHFLDEQGKLSTLYTNDGLHLTGEGYQLWKSVLEKLNYCCKKN